jgi:hypothetical protein
MSDQILSDLETYPSPHGTLVRVADVKCRLMQQAALEQASAPAYGIIDPDYARYYSIIRCTAWQYGYAIGMHGSFTRDLDLIAVPWAETACVGDKLVQVICGRTDLTQHHKNPTAKPHGRLVFTLLLPGFGDPRWIDLSIVPRNDKAASQEAADGGQHG